MQFNSISFLIFFVIVSSLYYLIEYKFRWILLLAASCFFYMYFIPEYILILFATIVIDYISAIAIESSEGKKRKLYLIVSIVSTCAVLVIFKYYDFFQENIINLLNSIGFRAKTKFAHILLPIGLSFHTFQSLSYVIEVYRRNQKAEKHFGIYSLYVMFYPQLVTGPIERPQNLLRQLREFKIFKYQNIANGLRLMLFGFFIKMVIADNLGSYVDDVYSSSSEFSSASVRWSLVFYSFQIYGDFFAYSTIAVGSALCMGYSLIDNFKNPYLSMSIAEFWQRWHISLSSWFRDYVYFSLGGNRVKLSRWILNILFVFSLSGLWHGASWTFVLWGLAHGISYIIESRLQIFNKSINNLNLSLQNIFKAILILKTFILTSLIWVLFRSHNLEEVKNIYSSVFSFKTGKSLNIEPLHFLFLSLFIVTEFLFYNSRFDQWCSNKSVWIRWIIYFTLISLVLLCSSVQDFPFIYFQF